MVRRHLVVALLLFVSACAGPQASTDDPAVPAGAHENLNSVLWVQTAAEYEAVAEQSYRLARLMVERALEDTAWTAALEQRGQAYGALPPAVVLDVDETVLDNAPYQARRIRAGGVYTPESWAAWVREVRAEAVPGALAFTRYAAARGVRVVYLTNRDAALEAATRRNLEVLGFPVADGEDVVLTRAERPDWEEKGPRREAVATRYRVLLLVGDNLGDFVSGADTTAAARAALAERYAEYWGRQWIMLPNPQYGSWEGALLDFDYGRSREAQIRRKTERLDPGGGS